MITKQNLHTHTTYVDGKDKPEEMVIEAIKRGLDSLGFSEHSLVECSLNPKKLTLTQMEKYIAEINTLKEKYRDKIKIYCGLELDLFSSVSTKDLDYVIGSAHYIKIGEKYYVVDGSKDETSTVIKEQFGDDGLKFARKYYETVSQIPEVHKVDIIGHFDLLAKNIERLDYLDSTAREYLNLGFEAIHNLKGRIPLFEVNTGAIARGYRTKPYPQIDFIKEFKNCGFGAVITTDCHDKNFLECYFEESKQLLIMAGYDSYFVLTDDGFREVQI